METKKPHVRKSFSKQQSRINLGNFITKICKRSLKPQKNKIIFGDIRNIPLNEFYNVGNYSAKLFVQSNLLRVVKPDANQKPNGRIHPNSLVQWIGGDVNDKIQLDKMVTKLKNSYLKNIDASKHPAENAIPDETVNETSAVVRTKVTERIVERMFNIIKVVYANTRKGYIPAKDMFIKLDAENLTEIDIRDENKCDFCYNALAKRTMISEGLLESSGKEGIEHVKWIGDKPTVEMVAAVNERLSNARKNRMKKYAGQNKEGVEEVLMDALEGGKTDFLLNKGIKGRVFYRLPFPESKDNSENEGLVELIKTLIESNNAVIASNKERIASNVKQEELILKLTGWLEKV